MKKNKVNYDAAMKQMDMLMPEELKEPYKTALTTCKDSGLKISKRYNIILICGNSDCSNWNKG